MAITKLILLKDVEDLGLAGEEVHVSPGYARNFLIPKKLAAPASASALKQIAARKEKIEAERQAALEAAQALAAKIAETAVTINMQASDDGHLFGSVTDRAIAEAFAAAGIACRQGIFSAGDTGTFPVVTQYGFADFSQFTFGDRLQFLSDDNFT